MPAMASRTLPLPSTFRSSLERVVMAKPVVVASASVVAPETVSVPCNTELPDVVAPPEMVSPPVCVPFPMVVLAVERRPPVKESLVEVASLGNGYAKKLEPAT